MGGKLGKFLNLNFNFFGNVVMKMAFGDKTKLDKQTKFQLTHHTPTSLERKGVWVFPREIIGSSDWLNSIWQRRQKIENKPTIIIWGMKDIAFRSKELNTFKDFLKDREVIVLDDVGHYVQDEAGDIIIAPIKEFLKK